MNCAVRPWALSERVGELTISSAKLTVAGTLCRRRAGRMAARGDIAIYEGGPP
jgi:hypothetical protein